MGHKEVPVTHLRKMTLDELQRRNYAQSTVDAYISALRIRPVNPSSPVCAEEAYFL